MTSITLKNIPDDLLVRIKDSASQHRRSVNSEIIYCLEKVLLPRQITTEERIERARRLRERIKPGVVSAEDISKAIKAKRL